jgi:hypothetical protein
MIRPLFPVIAALVLLCVVTAPARGAEADLKADLARMQGKWKGTLTVDEGSSVWNLENKGNKAKLNINNKDGGEVLKLECDFKLEQHGKFRAYTYSHIKYLTGDKAGQTELTDGKTRSSLYKFDGSEAFSTIGGFGDDDESPHWLIRWEKVKE